MGIVRRGPPEELVCHLAQEHAIDTFVETGTWAGDTALWAAQHFSRVITIEKSQSVHQAAAARLRPLANVECRLGDSRQELEMLAGTLRSPAIFWLDSHWCGGESYGGHDECPLVEELHILNKAPVQHFLFIDDARLFLSPPPSPHLLAQWPTIADVCRVLTHPERERYVVVFEDVIVAVPDHSRASVATWCQRVNTQAWNEFVRTDAGQSPGLQRGIAGKVGGARLVGQAVRRKIRRTTRGLW